MLEENPNLTKHCVAWKEILFQKLISNTWWATMRGIGNLI